MYTHILVATDGSDLADSGVGYPANGARYRRGQKMKTTHASGAE
jgi:hypothetical protein